MMDRLMNALKKVKIDSGARMAAITQVEQEVQTRSHTVISDRLITNSMIQQQLGQLKSTRSGGGGIEALERARALRLEALRSQYREESLSLNHSYPIDDSDDYKYTSSDEEDEGGLASIVQGLIKSHNPDFVGSSEEEEEDDEYYYSDEEEEATVFESIGQLVHERFAANRNSLNISLDQLREAGILDLNNKPK